MGLSDYFANKKALRLAQKEAEKAAAEQADIEAQRLADELAARERTDTEEAKRMISQSPLMDGLMAEMESEPWIFCRQGTDDYGNREITFTYDGVHIKYSKLKEVEHESYNKLGMVKFETEYVETICAEVAYSYTKSGYAPLSSYKSLSRDTVLFLWEEEWKKRMKERVPGIKIFFNRYSLPLPTKRAF